MAKTGIKRRVVPVPADLDEAAKFVGQVAEAQRAINEVKANLNSEVDALKIRAREAAKPHEDKIAELCEGIFSFAQARRDELTKGGRKTVNLPTGALIWRMTPPSVSIRNIKEVLARLKKLKLQRFIRPKEEIDKEAMLRERKVAESVSGVSISQHEEFVVKPAELEVEIATRIEKTKSAA